MSGARAKGEQDVARTDLGARDVDPLPELGLEHLLRPRLRGRDHKVPRHAEVGPDLLVPGVGGGVMGW